MLLDSVRLWRQETPPYGWSCVTAPTGGEVPDALAGRRVLVTGGAGFIGSRLTRRLTDRCEVRVLDDLSTGSRSSVPDGATLRQGDIRDRETVEAATGGVDVIFHQAGLVSVSESVDRPAATQAINATGTLNVLEAARRADTQVVLASSAAIYGHPETVPIAEDDPKRPSSPYGLSKLSTDWHARLYHELYGLPTVALRYFNVYGPGATSDYAGVIETFLQQARDGGPLTVHGDGAQTRDFVHVDDVVGANLAAAVTDCVGRAYNVGTGTAHSIAELAELVERATDADLDIVHTAGRSGDINESCADISRARRELGYEPTVGLRTGLELIARQRL